HDAKSHAMCDLDADIVQHRALAVALADVLGADQLAAKARALGDLELQLRARLQVSLAGQLAVTVDARLLFCGTAVGAALDPGSFAPDGGKARLLGVGFG